MNEIVLSDHIGDRLREAADTRRAQHERQIQSWREAHAAYQARDRELRAEYAKHWREWRPWRALLAYGRWLAFSLGPTPPATPPQPPCADASERVWEAGREGGEQRVKRKLAGELSDEWTAINGYWNPRGEIDLILVGPSGVIAIEVKNVNGVVDCDGVRWWYDRYGRYGNCVEARQPFADKRGRSPGRQLNEPADRLQAFLAQHVGPIRVGRAVILAHDNARYREQPRFDVDFVGCLGAFPIERITRLGRAALDAQGCERVVRAIVRDHRYHERHRQNVVIPSCSGLRFSRVRVGVRGRHVGS